jgi:hypothetical protein
MASFPGMIGEVFWGDPATPLPDWRKQSDQDETDDDDRPLSVDERKHLVSVLGFDPDEEAKEASSEVSESAADRLARTAAMLWETEYP